MALTSNQSAEQNHFDLLPFIAIMMCLLGTLLLVHDEPGPDQWLGSRSGSMEVTGRRVLAKWDERQEIVKVLSDLDSTLRELKPLLARLAEGETKK